MVQWRMPVGTAVVVATMAVLAITGDASRAILGPQVMALDTAANTTNDTQAPTTTVPATTTTPPPTTVQPSTTIATTIAPTTPAPQTTAAPTPMPSTTLPPITTTTTVAPPTTTPTTTTTSPPTPVPTTAPTDAPPSDVGADESTQTPPPTQGATEAVRAPAGATTPGGVSGPAMACLIVGGLILVCLSIILVIRSQRHLAKKRLSDKDDVAMRYSHNDGLAIIDSTEPPGRYPYKQHPAKSPVPVLSLRHYESDTSSTVKTESTKTMGSNTSFNMYARHTCDSIDSYRPSPHGDAFRNMESPTYTPLARPSHTFSDTMSATPRTSRRTSDFSFSTQFARGSTMSTPGFGVYPSNLLRNSDDLSVYSDRSEGTNF